MTKHVIYQAKIELGKGMRAPDSWDGSAGLTPPSGFVVARNSDGSIAATYGEPSWNWTPYDPDGRFKQFHFHYWTNAKNINQRLLLADEMRYLMFLLIWKRRGSPLSSGSLDCYLTAFRRLALFCEMKGCKMKDVLCDFGLLVEFVKSRVSLGLLRYFRSLLKMLMILGRDEVGFSVLGSKADNYLGALVKRYRDGARQFAVIPSRIYSLIISAIHRELEEWEKVSERYLSLVKACLDDPLLGKCEAAQRRTAARRCINRDRGEFRQDFISLLKTYDLESYFEQKELKKSFHGLSKGLTSLMILVKLYVMIFTGMRKDEVEMLPYHCAINEKDITGKVHCIVKGRTTKFGRKQTEWITNAEGHRAIEIGQKISNVIYKHMGVKPQSGAKLGLKYPLFVSPSYLEFLGTKAKGEIVPFVFDFENERFSSLRNRLQPTIEEADLLELEAIDPHRSWRTEREFQIGSPWRLTDHQLRRSLAVYAHRSGLVSLPSLRRQLQHITEEMSRYYAKGSEFARNFIGDDPEHFGYEWQDGGELSSYLAYSRDVLFPPEPIFGGHANALQKMVSLDGKILVDRDSTLRKFRNGEISYMDTPLGGCTKVGECDRVPVRVLNIHCMGGCQDFVGKLSKLERVITVQSVLVEKLDVGSVEWRAEKADLDVLIATKERVLKRKEE